MGSQAALRPSLLQQRTLGQWVRHARAPGRTLRPRPGQSKVVRALISRAMGQGKASHSEAAVIIPLNYAQVRMRQSQSPCLPTTILLSDKLA